MITVKGLKAGYGQNIVLKGIDLDVPEGDFLGVLGPNACGKSTLIKVLSGVLDPSEGEVTVHGHSLPGAEPKALAKAVATIPQSTEIPFPFTGEELVTMGRFPHMGRFSPVTDADRDAIEKALISTDTVELAKRLVTQISGGERQRLAMARALAQAAPILLMDEGTAAMDVHRKIDTFDLLKDKNDEGLTIVAVMHDLNLAALYCERMLFMKEGEIFAFGATRDVFTSEVISAVYETPVELFTHPHEERPQALFLPRR